MNDKQKEIAEQIFKGVKFTAFPKYWTKNGEWKTKYLEAIKRLKNENTRP